jgi:hypothetical protein
MREAAMILVMIHFQALSGRKCMKRTPHHFLHSAGCSRMAASWCVSRPSSCAHHTRQRRAVGIEHTTATAYDQNIQGKRVNWTLHLRRIHVASLSFSGLRLHPDVPYTGKVLITTKSGAEPPAGPHHANATPAA